MKNHNKKFKPFLTNRVSEVQTSSLPEKLNNVKLKENPADLLPNGMSIEDLADSELWWYNTPSLRNRGET